jgi:hypothetical protein
MSLQLLIWFSCTTLRSKNDRSAFDLFALCPGIKSGFVKFCKAHELRIRTLLLTFRVIRGNFELMLRMSKIEYSPQSEAALTNFKALLLLEIALSSGNDYDWSSPAVKGGGAAVLPAGSAHDDADESGAEAVASPEGEAAAAADAASAVAAGAASAATCKRCPFV